MCANQKTCGTLRESFSTHLSQVVASAE